MTALGKLLPVNFVEDVKWHMVSRKFQCTVGFHYQ